MPHIVTWTVAGVDAETLLMTLEDRGVLCGTVPADQLVRAGLAAPDEVAVRFGLSYDTTEEEVERVLAVVPPAVHDLCTIAARAESAFAAQRDPNGGRRPGR